MFNLHYWQKGNIQSKSGDEVTFYSQNLPVIIKKNKYIYYCAKASSSFFLVFLK